MDRAALFSLSLRLCVSVALWPTILISLSQWAFSGPGHGRRWLPDRGRHFEIRVGARRRQSLEGDLQDLVHSIDGVDLHRIEHVGGNLGQVLLILLRDDDRRDASAAPRGQLPYIVDGDPDGSRAEITRVRCPPPPAAR